LAKTFYRIVKSPGPTDEDFLPGSAKGPPPRNDAEMRHVWTGTSVYSTLNQARNKARDYPFLGQYIATVVIPDGSSVTYERTLRSSRGHYTLWGDASLLRAYVTSIVPVEP
jgi:hypothetical protein